MFGAAPAEDWGGLGGWAPGLGGEGGRPKAVEAAGVVLLLLDISPVAVSAWLYKRIGFACSDCMKETIVVN